MRVKLIPDSVACSDVLAQTATATVAGVAGVLAIALPGALMGVAIEMAMGTVAHAQAQIQTQTQVATPIRSHLIARSTPVVRPDLEVGAQDSSVSELQATLKLLGFYSGAVTDIFSAETSQAVAQFQAAAGIPATGRVSARTWDRLFPPASGLSSGTTAGSAAAPVAATPLPKPRPPVLSNEPAVPAPQPPAPEPVPAASSRPAASQPEAQPDPFPTLREGAEGEAVARLQRLLKRQGVFPGGIDGDFGPVTLEAVIAAQEKLGLEADGVVGPATWRALRR